MDGSDVRADPGLIDSCHTCWTFSLLDFSIR
jgi:hypothetical protein